MTDDANNTTSDQNVTLEDAKKIVQQFCDERDWDQFHGPKELATGLIIEAAELLEMFRFRSPEESMARLQDPNSNLKIENELADVLYFVLRFSQMYDIDLITALTRKMRENAKKYPVETAKGRNAKYDEL